MPQKRVEGVGEASLYKGDPRLATSDIDEWYNGILTHVGEPKARAHLWGADAGLCARRNVLLEHNTWVSSTTTASSNAYMSIGVALEDMLASSLREKHRLLTQGMYLVEIPNLKIRGKIDLIIQDHTDELALVEVKTCGKLPTEPSPVHLAQIELYSAVSGFDRAWLTYISRNVATQPWGPGLAMRTFSVDTAPQVLRKRLQTAVLSRLASDAHRLPPVPAHFRKHTECHYCEFRDAFCWLPRPGSAPSEPPEYAPMREIDTELLVNLDREAYIKSIEILEDRPYRKRSTLHNLLELPLYENLVKKVMEEYQEVLSLILL